MKIGILLHLYQPPVQKESVVKQIANECYYPLLKLIKNRKELNLALNVPLSFLEIMDKYGYRDWIQEIKSLYENNRIELVGSGAYHPLLTKLPEEILEEQIIMNEYGLGYYLGATQDFEGDSAIMMRDLKGFFPPELAINENVLNTLSDLGYGWTLASEKALENVDIQATRIYKVKDYKCNVVLRDDTLSNMISFARTLDVKDIQDYMNKHVNRPHTIIALDGEFFGHHYKDGITLFNIILDMTYKVGNECKMISDIVQYDDIRSVSEIHETSWGEVDRGESDTKVYPLWLDERNDIQMNMFDLEQYVLNNVLNSTSEGKLKCGDGFDQFWTNTDYECQKRLFLHKFLCSDKYWWLSKKVLPAGEFLYDTEIVLDCLTYIKRFLLLEQNEDIKNLLKNKLDQIEKEMK